MTKDQYNYWANLKKTTEQPGTIFDPQSSQLNSNIHCLSNPAEPVLGYLCASSTTKKRIFINRSDLSYYNYTPYWLSCQLDTNVIVGISTADKQKDYDYLAKPGHLFTLYEVFTGDIRWFPMYVVIAGNTEELLLSPGSGPNLKLAHKMILLTKKDLNLIGNNCLLDICAKSDLSH